LWVFIFYVLGARYVTVFVSHHSSTTEDQVCRSIGFSTNLNPALNLIGVNVDTMAGLRVIGG
jgi:hypothetical protein